MSLGKKEPVPVGEAEGHIGAPEGLEGRDDVEDGNACDALGLVEGEAVSDAAAAVVAGDGEALEAEAAHESDGVTPHCSLRIGFVVRRSWWFRAVAVTTQVRGDDGEVAGKL